MNSKNKNTISNNINLDVNKLTRIINNCLKK